MCNVSPSDKYQDKSDASSLTPRLKALLVASLLTALFALFNMLYWPTRAYQERSHPASFVARARHQLDAGAVESALDTLVVGIERINPPIPEPYALLAQVKETLNDPTGAEAARHRAAFYRALQHAPPDVAPLVSAAEALGEKYASLRLDARASGLPRRAAAAFGAAFNMRDTLIALPTHAQLALFEMTGSAFSLDGTIGGADVVAPMPLLAYSGGGMDERGNAHILVDGRDYADRQRGMHVVLLAADTGAVLQTGVFDLWESVEEAKRMQFFLQDAPRGCIGLFAVRDDGSAFLTPALEQALFDFGIGRRAMVGRASAVLGLRYSFAAIGVKGAAPGSAMQSWSPEEFKGKRGHPVVCAVFHGEEAR